MLFVCLLACFCKVTIPSKDITSGKINFIDFLSKIKPEEITAKQAYISEIAFRLQYSIVPEHISQIFNISRIPSGRTIGRCPESSIQWHPPYRDAVDVIVDKFIDRFHTEFINYS